MKYRILEATNQYSSYAFEDIENQINCAAKQGYRLDRPLQLIFEDGDVHQVRIYHVIAVLTKDEV
ncbi:hypothetical protein IJG96_01425 [Candidatus Saccharibacteria bacterium]|nr:hypothetical protein [Candidatus Saccharibacteria bacterium]